MEQNGRRYFVFQARAGHGSLKSKEKKRAYLTTILVADLELSAAYACKIDRIPN
jgi:hypothetical protein